MKAMLDPNESNADFREEDLEIVDTDKRRILYNDNNELLVIGRTSNPIKNDPTMDMSFVLRFDV